MRAGGGALERGREAFAAADWSAVYDALHPLRSALGVDDLALLARSEWMRSRVPESLELSEELFHRYRAEDRAADAASTALLLTLLWVTRGESSVGSAWLSRARRLLAEREDSVVHGYLAYVEAMVALELGGELGDSLERLSRLSGTLRDPALESFELVIRGLLDLRAADIAAGFARLDEAMLPVIAGRVPVEWAGDIYCTVIHACHQLADFRRMADWTRATERWCEQFAGEAIYGGICRIHRLELRAVHGEWEGLESRLLTESRALEGGNAWVAGEGFRQLGEIRRLRGDDAGAREAYRSALEAGVDPQPGLALLDLAAGRGEVAWEALGTALSAATGTRRAVLLRAGVEIGIAVGRLEEAAAMADGLRDTAQRFGTSGMWCWSLHADGAVALARGRHSEAVGLLERAAASFRAERRRHDVARALADLAQAHEGLGNVAVAEGFRGESGRILAVLAACDERGGQRAGAGPLTAREVEVLECVAVGMSNREVAGRLFISEKTVGRHLANIYLKLDVGTRTAAVAWWREHA